MKELEPYRYQPEEANVELKTEPIPTITDTEAEEYGRKVKELCDKLELIELVCDYLKTLVDHQSADVAVKYDPEDYPDVYRSMRRLFPNAEPTMVTYQQYRLLHNFKMDLIKAGVY